MTTQASAAIKFAFERWFLAYYTGVDLALDDKGAYANPTTVIAWNAFKAGRAYIPSAKQTTTAAESAKGDE